MKRLFDPFSAALENGIVLCYLIKEIDPGLIPFVHDGLNMPKYRHRENINFFLAALEDLQIPLWCRFQCNDLFEQQCFPQVVICLMHVAQMVQERGFKIPLPTGPTVQVTVLPPPDQLIKLKQQLTKLKAPPSKNKRGRAHMSDAVLRRQLAILSGGEGKVSMDRIVAGFTRFQAYWRGYRARKAYQKLTREAAYRRQVANELLQTEVEYVKSLGIAIEAFMKPMQTKAIATHLLTEEQFHSIFSELEVIHGVNLQLLEVLKPIVTTWQPNSCLGKALQGMVALLSLYTGYVSHLDRAMTTLETLRQKNSKFNTFVIECRSSPANTKMLELPGYLIQPVQRVPRYYLLLTDLIKHTWPDHPDFEQLKVVCGRVQAVATILNEKKREAETVTRMVQIDLAMSKKPKDFVLIVPSRLLLKEAQFTCSRKDIKVFLFNDMVCWGQFDGKKIKFLASEALKNLEFVAGANGVDFQIHKFGMKLPLVELTSPSAEARTEWLKATEAAITEMKQKVKGFVTAKEKQLELKDPSAPEMVISAEETLRLRRIQQRTAAAEETPPSESVESLKSRKTVLETQLAEVEQVLKREGTKKGNKEIYARSKEVQANLVVDLASIEEQITAAQEREAAAALAAAKNLSLTPVRPNRLSTALPKRGVSPGPTGSPLSSSHQTSTTSSTASLSNTTTSTTPTLLPTVPPPSTPTLPSTTLAPAPNSPSPRATPAVTPIPPPSTAAPNNTSGSPPVEPPATPETETDKKKSFFGGKKKT
ncbi:guanine nucleotide exchange factor [Pelomyxa schiedti]|nr:guanine nucleotide exchange factor [Pelomyxa schiedti]